MEENKVKKIQEDTRKQILGMVNDWLKHRQKDLNVAVTEKDKIRLAGEVSALTQMSINIEFMKIK